MKQETMGNNEHVPDVSKKGMKHRKWREEEDLKLQRDLKMQE